MKGKVWVIVLMVFVLQGWAEFRLSLSDDSEVCDPDAAFGATSYLVAWTTEGKTAARLSYHGLVPETVWITIPRELYQEDCEVTLEVIKNAGKFASLAGLTLYQLYPYRQKGKGGNYAGVGTSVTESPVRLNAVRPSPFRGRTQVYYSVTQEQRCSVRIYDIQGRLVKTLLSGVQPPGLYSCAWDGCDETGKPLPAGIYYLRLESGTTATSHGVVLVR